jgi:tetratricopeptide (TPR) repeat protein
METINLRDSSAVGPRVTLRRSPTVPSSGLGGSEMPTSASESGKPRFIVKLCDKLITISLFAIFFGIPLFFTGITFQGIAFEKEMFFFFWVLLALVAWVSKSVITGEMKIRRTMLDIPVVLFWAVYLVSTFFSVDRWHSFLGFFGDPSRGFMGITALTILYFIIVSNFDKKRFFWILTAMISSISFMVVWALVAILGLKVLPDKLAAYFPLSFAGSIGSLGAMATFLLPLITMSVFKISERNDLSQKLKRGISILLMAIMVVDLFLILTISSFFSWFGILAGIVVFLIFILSKIVRPSETWLWLPMVLFVVIMAFLLIGQVKISQVNLPVEVSMKPVFSWTVAQESLKHKFFLGSGPASYGYDFSLFKGKEFNLNVLYNLRFYQGTGLFFESLATIGAVGSFLLAMVILSFLGMGGYYLTKDKERNKIYSLGMFSASIILLTSIIVSNAEASLLLLTFLAMIATFAVILWESQAKEEYLSFSLKASPKFALALAFIFLVVSAGVAFLFVFIGRVFVADVYAGSAVRDQVITEAGTIGKLSQAVKLNPQEGRYYTAIGQRYMAMANSEMLKNENERDIPTIQRYLNNAIIAAKQGRAMMPNDVLAAESLAQIYENASLYVTEAAALAEEAYLLAADLDPENPNYALKIGQVKTALATTKKDDDEKKKLITDAKDLFQRSADLKPNFAPGYYYLSLAQEALGDRNLAIGNMESAVTYQGNNVDYVFNLARMYQDRGEGDDLKNAEALYKQILGVNSNEINTHFKLGSLFEKTGKKSEAIDEYKKVLDILPDNDNTKQTREQLNKMISNIQNGIENTPENLGLKPTTNTNSSNNQAPAVQSSENNQPAQ